MTSKYDSILFGNGLTIGFLSQLSKHITSPILKYLDVNNFIYDIAVDDGHKRISRELMKYFNLNNASRKSHRDSKAFILENIDDIRKIGFERWFGSYIFEKNNTVRDIKFYLYILYNYWWHVLDENILSLRNVLNLRSECGSMIGSQVKNRDKIFSTNFDNLLDPFLDVKHVHGRFLIPLLNLADMEYIKIDNANFEYPYLFGTNGYEKLNRLDFINKTKQDNYDLSIFFDLELNLNSLLIFGLSFGLSKIIPAELQEKYTNFSLVDSVDGHLLMKLQERYSKKKLSKITVTYFTDSDLENLKKTFRKVKLDEITSFIHSSEVMDFENAL